MPRFSVRELLLATTLVAVSCFLFGKAGASPIWLLAAPALYSAWVTARENNREVPFWMTVSAGVLPVFVPSLFLHYQRESEETVVVIAIFGGLGTYLVFCGVMRGHWTTKILAYLVLVPYTLLVASAVLGFLSYPDFYFDYWRGDLP